MAPCSNKENHPPTSSKLLSRRRKLSSKQSEANKNAQEAAQVKEIKKQLQAARAKKRASVKKANAVVERVEDSKEVRELKARVHRAELERDAAERQAELALRHSSTQTAAQPDSIPRPPNFSKVTVRLLRQHLGLEGAEHKMEWLRIRNHVRDTLAGIRIDWGLNWKGQRSRKLAKLFDAVEEAEPSLRRFQNQWAIEYLAKEAFTNHKTYTSCRDNPTTYRGRRMGSKNRSRPPNEPSPSDESRNHSPNEPNLSNQRHESPAGPDNRDSYSPSASPFTGSLPALSDVDNNSGDEEDF